MERAATYAVPSGATSTSMPPMNVPVSNVASPPGPKRRSGRPFACSRRTARASPRLVPATTSPPSGASATDQRAFCSGCRGANPRRPNVRSSRPFARSRITLSALVSTASRPLRRGTICSAEISSYPSDVRRVPSAANVMSGRPGESCPA
jgi:hypothetical protein